MPDWSKYLKSVTESVIGSAWGDRYTHTDVSGKVPREARYFTGLRARVHKLDRDKDRVERVDALEGLRQYAAEHVVLAGLPGSGKTTTLDLLSCGCHQPNG